MGKRTKRVRELRGGSLGRIQTHAVGSSGHQESVETQPWSLPQGETWIPIVTGKISR